MKNKLKLAYFNATRGLHTFAAYWSGYRVVPKPSVMYVELTYRCTCKCSFCDRWKIGPEMASRELTTEEMKKLFKDAYGIGVRYVGFTGGEAFLRKDIFELGEYARSLGMNITVASNGTLINEGNIERIAKTFNSIAISMDGFKKETHDSLRGVEGVYDKAMRALELIKQHKLPVTVNMVVNSKNYLEIDDYLAYFQSKNIPVQLTPVHDYAGSFLNVNQNIKNWDVGKFNAEWQRLTQKYPLLTRGFYQHVPKFIEDPKSLTHVYTCFAGSVVLFVNPLGDVFPCEFLRSKMGNVSEKPLKQIWSEALELRKYISSPKRACVCWTHCIVPLNIRLSKYIRFQSSV